MSLDCVWSVCVCVFVFVLCVLVGRLFGAVSIFCWQGFTKPAFLSRSQGSLCDPDPIMVLAPPPHPPKKQVFGCLGHQHQMATMGPSEPRFTGPGINLFGMFFRSQAESRFRQEFTLPTKMAPSRSTLLVNNGLRGVLLWFQLFGFQRLFGGCLR